MKALHKALIKELRLFAEAVPIIEGALDATVEHEFDLVIELIVKFRKLRDESECDYNLMNLICDARNENNT